MRLRLYVGNLPFATTDDELRAHFEPHGTVYSARVVTDRESGRPRGFGFVIMDADAAAAARSALDGTQLSGRPLRVSDALRQPEGGEAEA